MMPFISIITINYNDVGGLRRTLDSVRAQSLSKDCFEYLVIDGGSTDGGAELLKEYSDIIDVAVSERDKGIYNAMNKGVGKATGEYVIFLNSGDTLSSPGTLEEINSMRGKINADVVVACVNLVHNGEVVSRKHTVSGELTLFNLCLTGVPHQGTMARRSLLLANPFDEKYRINSDFKFFLETIIMQGCSVQYMPELTIADYDLGGISTTDVEKQRNERLEIMQEVVPARILEDYLKVLPHYYEVTRVGWLLEHKFFYKAYRAWCTLGRKLLGCQQNARKDIQ